MLKETFNALQPTFNSQFRGAQAASLFVAAACRDAPRDLNSLRENVAGELPPTAGWQPALRGITSTSQ
jgi:hypothetical protein